MSLNLNSEWIKKVKGMFYLSLVVLDISPVVARVDPSLVHHDSVQGVLELLQPSVRVHTAYLGLDVSYGRL